MELLSMVFLGIVTDEGTGARAVYRCSLIGDATGAWSLVWTWTATGETQRFEVPPGDAKANIWAELFTHVPDRLPPVR